MTDKKKQSTTESSEQGDTKSNFSRREFFSKSTGTIAAASLMAAGASLVSTEASANWPKGSETSIDGSLWLESATHTLWSVLA